MVVGGQAAFEAIFTRFGIDVFAGNIIRRDEGNVVFADASWFGNVGIEGHGIATFERIFDALVK